MQHGSARSSVPPRTVRTWLLIATMLLMATGCGRENGIRKYTVERPKPADRMLAAVLPQTETQTAWFFKLTGPNSEVAELEERFADFVRSLRFEGDAVDWDLPEGWQQRAGSGMRYATIEIASADTEEPLDLSVTRLPLPEEDSEGYLLSNINRWRGQLQLGPLASDQLANESEAVTLSGDESMTATIINIAGNLGASGGMGAGSGLAPFASAGNEASSPVSSETPKITYTAPELWEPGQEEVQRGGIVIRRPAAFNVRDGEDSAEVTVTTLGGAAGDLALNVNRWRSQVQLPAVSEDELAAETSEIEFAGAKAKYVELIGPQQAILGVIAVVGDRAWFVKLHGSHELAIRERERFREFVSSIAFES